MSKERLNAGLRGTYRLITSEDASGTPKSLVEFPSMDGSVMMRDEIRLLGTPSTLATALGHKFNATPETRTVQTLAEDPTLFWNSFLLWSEQGTVGDPEWNDILRASEDEDASGSLLDERESDEPRCKYFAAGGCRFGNDCRFSHSLSRKSHNNYNAPGSYQTQAPPGAPPCKFFASSQGCRFGDQCRFAHITFMNAQSNESAQPYAMDSHGDDSGMEEFDIDEAEFEEMLLSQDVGKDFYNPCQNCGGLPTVVGTGLCGQCCFGKRDW